MVGGSDPPAAQVLELARLCPIRWGVGGGMAPGGGGAGGGHQPGLAHRGTAAADDPERPAGGGHLPLHVQRVRAALCHTPGWVGPGEGGWGAG